MQNILKNLQCSEKLYWYYLTINCGDIKLNPELL